MFDGKAFGMEMTEIVRGYVDKAVAPLLARIEELETREPIQGPPGEKGMPGERGQDGSGIADLLIDRDGSLVASFSDGRMKALGVVVGKDGADADMDVLAAKLQQMVDALPRPADGKDGADGKDADMVALETKLAELVAAIPPPADGKDGSDGKDAYPGEVKGLYIPGESYRARDIVMFDGTSWIARSDDPGEIPGDGWMQLASRGKAGKPGERGEPGREGMPGKDGASPVAVGFDPVKMSFEMILDNGEQLETDFYPLAKAIRGDV